MLLEKMDYHDIVEYFKIECKTIFCDEMRLIEEQENFEPFGYFKLKYYYSYLEYYIVIENEKGLFSIMIIDKEGAKNVLQRISPFDNSLEKDNIRYALGKLKLVLEKNEFDLYLSVENRLYRKTKQELKRVKDIRELLNG